ncbi:oxygen-regulated protein 1 [Ctenopharyngodon idella]|uniref:oxygen-regulated protein 1 n=1 Tax=Ctenopharyngodon idella TaxID=7959 RepID=UPI0022301D22|nr:oxygen-regulated protein 1 [Ctenopharyngodon idella]
MSEAPVVRKVIPQAQSTASGHTQMTSRQPYITETSTSKRVCFYKSGDAQFSGLPVIINSRTFKTFEALLDSLSKRVPLPFGVRTITTPRGHTAVRSLDQLHHGQSYICSDRRTVKPIDLERARRKPPPWYHARPVSARRLAWYTHSPAQHGTYSARRNERVLLHTPKRLVLFRNGEPEVKHTLTLQRRTTYSFEALLDHMSEVMRFPVLKLYTPEGRRVDGLPALILCSGVLVAAGREPFKKSNYDVQKSSPPVWPPAKRLGRRHPITSKFINLPFIPISELTSKTYSYDTENTLRIQTKPLTELIDFQAQKFYTVKMSVRPDMKPVLDQLCYAIQSLREITQRKRSLCLKTSKCLPDFSSNLASTFGSSSRVLLAFLSVVTLKDGLSHLNTCCQTETNLRSEAMLMLQSLNELAVIEDAEHLRTSLSDLYNSASVQLLQNWKGFQVLSNKARSSSATPDTTGTESHHRPSSDEEEHSIQVLMEHLGVPERVREELAALNHTELFRVMLYLTQISVKICHLVNLALGQKK